MKIYLDTDKIPKDLTLQELLVLISVAAQKPILGEYQDKLVSRKYINVFGEVTLLGERVLSIIDTESVNITKDSLEELAKSLRELFPTGKKPGTNYMWRDSNILITERLRSFFSKFKVNCSNEDIIAATRQYIESFNGDYTYMQLLKYFIYKRDTNKGELTSQLLSYIENAGQEDFNRDWSTELK